MSSVAARTERPQSPNKPEELDVLIVGAGFSGLYQLDRLRDLGFSVKIAEAAPALGGVWYWNCYPGARTDVPGLIYQFAHKELWKDWDFDELYPNWEQLRAYFQHVDEKLDLSRDIYFDTRVKEAQFDEDERRWVVQSEDGKVFRPRFLVLCTGIGSKPYIPPIPGLSDFGGATHHTAYWPQGGVELQGERVGVIGTGASGVQVIQEIGPVVGYLTVFQRTPNMAQPMRQRALSAAEKKELKDGLPGPPVPGGHLPMDERLERRAHTFFAFDYDFLDYAGLTADGLTDDQIREIYEKNWAVGGHVPWLGNFADAFTDEDVNKRAYEFWRDKVRERIKRPEMVEKLAPTVPPHPYGVKRISLEQAYWEVFNQDNVELVDLRENPIERVIGEGVMTRDGTVHALDALVLATGFDMVSGGITAIDIKNAQDVKLRDQWKPGVAAYLGSMTHGFPNMFFVYGPHAPAGLSNGPSSSELQGEEIVRLLQYLRDAGRTRIEPTEEADLNWRKRVDDYAEATLFGRADSWYMQANIPGKTRQCINYPLGMPDYLAQWRNSADANYLGFDIR